MEQTQAAGNRGKFNLVVAKEEAAEVAGLAAGAAVLARGGKKETAAKASRIPTLDSL